MGLSIKENFFRQFSLKKSRKWRRNTFSFSIVKYALTIFNDSLKPRKCLKFLMTHVTNLDNQ